LQTVISAAIYLVSHDMSAWQQSVGSVFQVSCNTAAQLRCVCSAQLSSAQLPSEGSIATRQVSCQVRCSLSAELHPVSSDETSHLSCNVLAQL